MSKNNSYKPGPNDFLDYSEGKLKGRKRNAFERYLEQNLFDAEAMEGFDLVARDEAEQDLAAAGRQINRRINRRKRIGWYSAAAAVVSILAISTIFFNVDRSASDKQELVPELPKGMESASEKKAAKDNLILEESKESEESEESEEVKDIEEQSEQVLSEEVVPEEVQTEEFMTEELMTEELMTEEAVQISDDEGETPGKLDDASPQLGAGAVADEEEVVQEFAMDMEDEQRMETKNEPLAAPSQAVTAAREKSAMKRMAAESDIAPPSAVRGVVISSEDAAPIPGATIMLKGTSVGTVADSEGNFELKIEDTDDQQIVASFIGMESKEMTVQAGTDVEIAMNESLVSLDEVVVVGYGTSRAYKNTGSIQSIETNIIGAEPEIGLSAYNDYIDNELVFPRSEYDNSRAVVVVKFIVLQNKRPYNIQVVRSPSQAFFNEAQRVVFSGPDWEPATKNGAYVEDEVSLRIVFKEDHKR